MYLIINHSITLRFVSLLNMSHLHLLLLRLSEFWRHCCLCQPVPVASSLGSRVQDLLAQAFLHTATRPGISPHCHQTYISNMAEYLQSSLSCLKSHRASPQGPQVPSTATAAHLPSQRSLTHLLLCSTGPFATLRHPLTAHDFALCKCCHD